MGVIKEMRAKVGDFIHQWDLDNPDSIKNAETMFKELQKKGFMFFEVNSKDQSKGNLVRDFHAKLEEVIAVPPQAGG